VDLARAVLFDFGNTLFAHAPLPATIHEEATRLGATVDLEWAVDLAMRIDDASRTVDEMTHPRDLDADVWHGRWHVMYGVADSEVPGLGAAVYRAMHDPAAWIAYRSTQPVLKTLARAGVRVAVVSNTGWDVRTVLQHHRLDQFVTSWILSYEVGAVKPSPEIFECACVALGVDPTDALMVGDDPVADAGAVRAGLRTLLLPAASPGVENGLHVVPSLAAR
jgi:FMN phosphatase YigB (HAD superfamily)